MVVVKDGPGTSSDRINENNLVHFLALQNTQWPQTNQKTTTINTRYNNKRVCSLRVISTEKYFVQSSLHAMFCTLPRYRKYKSEKKFHSDNSHVGGFVTRNKETEGNGHCMKERGQVVLGPI